eukprot:scaffold132480_cov54-Phaeocystis_antarctica.AAC.2
MAWSGVKPVSSELVKAQSAGVRAFHIGMRRCHPGAFSAAGENAIRNAPRSQSARRSADPPSGM